VLGGSKEAPPLPPGEGGAYDEFDRRADPPEGATRAVSGQSGETEWRLYAFRKDGKTCVHFATQSPTSGGAGRACQNPPLDPSTSTSARGRFGYGLTSAEVAKVRFEHGDGSSETFDTVAKESYAERFYAGPLARTPLRRIVALDTQGKVVAERTDMTAYNL
jgi:hypothetical protein